MNTGQMLITIGAIALLAVVILRVSTNLLVTGNILDKSKVSLIAVSLATSTIEEASNKSFDQATVSKSISNVSLLTSRANLGAEVGEVYPAFNDFDDYNSFRILPKIERVEVTDSLWFTFEIFCQVDYVTATQPETPTLTQQWHKRMIVKVTSDSMRDEALGRQDTIKMSTIFSYWYF